jgi:hypothetical protein
MSHLRRPVLALPSAVACTVLSLLVLHQLVA